MINPRRTRSASRADYSDSISMYNRAVSYTAHLAHLVNYLSWSGVRSSRFLVAFDDVPEQGLGFILPMGPGNGQEKAWIAVIRCRYPYGTRHESPLNAMRD